MTINELFDIRIRNPNGNAIVENSCFLQNKCFITSCFALCLNDVRSLKYFYILIQSFSYLSNVLMLQFVWYFNIQTKVRVNQLVVSSRLDEARIHNFEIVLYVLSSFYYTRTLYYYALLSY